MGNTLADITEDGNVWDEGRMTLPEDFLDAYNQDGENDEDAPPAPTFAVDTTPLHRQISPEDGPMRYRIAEAVSSSKAILDGAVSRSKAFFTDASSKAVAKRQGIRRRASANVSEEQVWTLEVDRGQFGQKLGLGMRIARNGRLEITSIDPAGLMHTWNTENPSRAIRIGDAILEVNGETTKDSIFKALLAIDKLCFRLARVEAIAELEASGFRNPQQVVLQPGGGEAPFQPASASKSSGSSRRKKKWAPLDSYPGFRETVLLTPQRLMELHPFLPLTVRFASNWKLIYCPRIHGTSLRTFYRQCQAWPGETLFLIKDSDDVVFGGFASSCWKVSREKLHYGAPNCFVFTYGVHQENSLLQVYPWAGGDDFFMFADADGFSMGGGKRYAIWISQDFLTGTSASSETFGNEGSLTAGEDFVIQHFECWAFDSDHFGSSLMQAVVREHRAGLRHGNDALNAAMAPQPEEEDYHERVQRQFWEEERKRGVRDLELREYASQAARFEAIS